MKNENYVINTIINYFSNNNIEYSIRNYDNCWKDIYISYNNDGYYHLVYDRIHQFVSVEALESKEELRKIVKDINKIIKE